MPVTINELEVVPDSSAGAPADDTAGLGRRLWARVEWEQEGGRWVREEVRGFRGHEELSRLFSFVIALSSSIGNGLTTPAPLPAPASMLRRPAVLSWGYQALEAPVRYVVGEIEAAFQVAEGDVAPHLEITLVPALLSARLTRRTRAFARRDPIDVATEVLREHCEAEGALRLDDMRLTRDAQPRPLVVQYDESDLAFAARLLDDRGVGFHFEHDERTARLVLTDSDAGRETVEGFRDFGAQIDGWPGFDGVRQGVAAAPRVVGARVLEELGERGEGTWERFRSGSRDCHHWHTLHAPLTSGDARALAAVEGQRAASEVTIGRSVFPAFRPGQRLAIGPGQLLVSVEHEASISSAVPYRATCTLTPLSVDDQAARTYRAPRATPRPTIPGVVRGFVVDPGFASVPGYGAFVEVQIAGFEEPLRARLGHPIANHEDAALFIPPYGTEVLVAFAGGDPDMPVIVGSVHPAALEPELLDDTRIALRSRGHVVELQHKPGEELLLLQSENKLEISSPGFKQTATSHELKVEADGEIKLVSSGTLHISASRIALSAGMITIDTGLVKVAGAIKCDALIATTVIASSYTPGAGNIW